MEPRVSVSRSVIPITTDVDRMYFGGEPATDDDQVGCLDGGAARFGKSYAGEPDRLAEELAKDAAVRSADTLLLTVPEPARRRLQRPPARDDRASTSRRRSAGSPRRSEPCQPTSSAFRSSDRRPCPAD